MRKTLQMIGVFLGLLTLAASALLLGAWGGKPKRMAISEPRLSDAVLSTVFQCSTQPLRSSRFPPNVTISYTLSGLSVTEQAAAAQAISDVQSVLNQLDLNITLTSSSGSPYTITFVRDDTIVYQGNPVTGLFEVVETHPFLSNVLWETQISVRADFNPQGNLGLSDQAADYAAAVQDTFTHELMHAFGLANTNNGCNPAYQSIMNSPCGLNDTSRSISTCDTQNAGWGYDDFDQSPDQEDDEEYENPPPEVCVTVWHVTYWYYDGVYIGMTYDYIMDYYCEPLEV